MINLDDKIVVSNVKGMITYQPIVLGLSHDMKKSIAHSTTIFTFDLETKQVCKVIV